MGINYVGNYLEQKASQYLKTLGIHKPSDINIEQICALENLDYRLGNASSYIVVNEYRLITINKHKSSKQQNFEFLHELSHNHFEHHIYLTQCSDFEQEACHFSLYLAIPIHMFQFINFESDNLIQEVSDMFNIPEEIAYQRLQNIFDNYNYYNIFLPPKRTYVLIVFIQTDI
ncbi:ImmA/IrrE family metallo-endopeptidase [Listeria booriae]|uniref:ImmA/IrrE family metallo-endopeptidase n=1 Tax=Listeria booriae TaxID=1552123 RepID=UPI001628B24E|nr:ImmA/IrrE family metallo-endopeptidase [Listeria booriae]